MYNGIARAGFDTYGMRRVPTGNPSHFVLVDRCPAGIPVMATMLTVMNLFICESYEYFILSPLWLVIEI
jgi:hypothetical protein